MRLLIAEEDAALAGFLRRGLESEGYQVQVVADGLAAMRAINAETPDLVILDLSAAVSSGSPLSQAELKMVKAGGLQVLRELRAIDAQLPVLVLTAGSDLETRLAFLDEGADDCMFKPLSLQELRARCRALLRRSNRVPESVVQVQDLALRRLERVVERGGRQIKLTNREYGLLEQLVLERGRCVTRGTLLERVWGLGSSETNVVDVYINYLRRKLDDYGAMPLIETVRGKGYRIALPMPALSRAAQPLAGQMTVL